MSLHLLWPIGVSKVSKKRSIDSHLMLFVGIHSNQSELTDHLRTKVNYLPPISIMGLVTALAARLTIKLVGAWSIFLFQSSEMNSILSYWGSPLRFEEDRACLFSNWYTLWYSTLHQRIGLNTLSVKSSYSAIASCANSFRVRKFKCIFTPIEGIEWNRKKRVVWRLDIVPIL